ncbi:hypothetical protein M422DRAFT_270013 [Sphaerobolus stellatus SS14]|uniref:Uncharacterized protein n=1 Tax=Sphaerobolus stellatus (strain SS14) TaxID=990650 RepID=A0A0C9UTR9_SPHS4|nr:hypothetical protein M422DRAFT_270013 [Sphaerobolus stellatus SS14]
MKIQKDQEILWMLAFAYNIVSSRMPLEITDHIETAMTEAGIPSMYIEGEQRGTPGYSIPIKGKIYMFQTAQRSPSEAYLAKYYISPSHSDKSYAEFAIFWEVFRSYTGIITRECPGGTFVDIGLKVWVHGAADTVCAFKPEYLHGTTLADCNLKWSGMVFAFSSHIKEAFEEARERAEKGVLIHITSDDGH